MHTKTSTRRPFSPARRILAGVGSAFAVAALLTLFLLFPRRCTDHRNAVAFDGVIERKEISVLESRRGSHLSYFLIVQDKTGKLVRIGVPREIYERAVVGMSVQKKSGASWPTLGNGQD
jgi:hypothetical protein